MPDVKWLVCVLQCGGKPRRALSSSLQGWPPELELSTSETPLSAGLGGNEPVIYTDERKKIKEKRGEQI